MLKNILLILLVFACYNSYCQNPYYCNGISLFYSHQIAKRMSYKSYYDEVHNEKLLTFRIGGLYSKNISRKFWITIGVNYNKDRIAFNFRDSLYIIGGPQGTEKIPVTGNSTDNFNLLEVPIGIDYIPINKSKWVGIVGLGAQMGFALSGYSEITFNEISKQFRANVRNNDKALDALRGYLNIGVGYQLNKLTTIYFMPKMIFSLNRFVRNNIYHWPVHEYSDKFFVVEFRLQRSICKK